MFPVQPLLAPASDQRSTACRGHALIPLRCPTTSSEFSKPSPRAPRQAHNPFRAFHPVRLRAAFWSDHEVIRSHCCTARPVGARPVLVSLRFDADPLRVRRPPPSGWGLTRVRIAASVLVRLRRAVSSVLGEIPRVFSSRRAPLPSLEFPVARSPARRSLPPSSLVRSRRVHRTPTAGEGQGAVAKSTGHPPRNREIPR